MCPALGKALSMVLRHRQIPAMRKDGFMPWEVEGMQSGAWPKCKNVLQLSSQTPWFAQRQTTGSVLPGYHTYIIHDTVAMRCFLFRVLGFSV